MIHSAMRDTVRLLRRYPGFVLLIVGMLAIGIGMNAAIFAVVDSVLLRPLGYHDADRIVSIRTHSLDRDHTNPRVGGGDFVDVAHAVRGIESAAYYQNWDAAVQVRGLSGITPVAYVSPRFSEVMGVTPVAGRLFGASDAGGTNALVSASFARTHFNSAEAAVGQPIRGENGLYAIVGVLPDGFSFPEKTAVWFEASPTPRVLDRTAYNQRMVAKRRSGVTPAQLAAELSVFSAALRQTNAGDYQKELIAVPLQESIVGSVAPTLHLLMGSAALVLLIVCANITHLQLVRATRQVREAGVRTALGASRARLAMGALLEVAVLSAAGCLGALLLAVPVLRLLVHLSPENLPRLGEVSLHWRAVLLSTLLTFLLMAVTALLPIWRSWHVAPSMVLRQDSTRGTESRFASSLRNAFVLSEVALTLALTAGAVLLTHQLITQAREDLGFNLEHLYALDSSMIEPQTLPEAKPGDPAAKAAAAEAEHAMSVGELARLDRALDTLRSVPGVLSAEAMMGAPLTAGGSDVGYAIDGRSVFAPPYKGLPDAELRVVSPGALASLGVPLLRGRALSGADLGNTPRVLLINRSLAQQQFPTEDALGKRIMCGFDATTDWWTVVGVVEDLKDTPGQPALPTMYVPVAQHPAVSRAMQLLVRTAPGSGLSTDALQRRLQHSDSNLAVNASTMAHNFDEAQRDLRFRTVLFESFAAVSILLAVLGMYGATAYAVSQRRFEFGVRMALGATRAQVLATVLKTALAVTLAGVAAGLAFYALVLHALTAYVGSFPHDPAALGIAAASLVLICLLAAAVPARAASTVDPMRALRSE